MEQVVVRAIERAEQSVVAIARGRKSVGVSKLLDANFVPAEFAAGVVIDSKGLVLTNYHVLGRVEENEFAVWLRRRAYLAKVKAADPWSDLAILEFDAQGLKPIKFGDAANLKKGQFVIALGNPYAIARDGNVSATWGIVSNLARKAPPAATGDTSNQPKPTLHHFGTLIQTDARLSLGTSGGALLNLSGDMIGLTTTTAALAGYERSAGYAIPIDEGLLRVLDRLKQGKEPQYGFLGVGVEPLSLAERRKGLFGVRLNQVVPGTPAAKYSLRQGDLITHVNDTRIEDADDLIRQVSLLPVDHAAKLTLLRENRLLGNQSVVKKNVVLSKKYVESLQPTISSEERRTWRGMRIDYATAIPMLYQLASNIDLDGCVAVVEVQSESPAWVAGLRAGAFLNHVDGRRVATPDEFFALANRNDGDVTLTLTAVVGGTLEITVEP